MKQYEREFFISMIRSGKIIIQKNGVKLIVNPPTIDQEYEACLVYDEAYKNCMIDGIMSEEQIEEWMRENEIWTDEDDTKIKQIQEDLEKLKIEIYNNRYNKKMREKIRIYIRSGEKQLVEALQKKHIYNQNSREGYALSEKFSWMIKNCTTKNNLLYNFEEVSLNYVIHEYQSKSNLSEKTIRELAREDPWKSIWSVRNNVSIKLFGNSEKQNLTNNQKHLVIWSQMYDNIQESLECPHNDVIEDDDLLDGWFIIQSKKREKEKLDNEFDSNNKNEKIKNSEEIFLMANPQDLEYAKKINSMNDTQGQIIKKRRFQAIKEKGSARHQDLPDAQDKMREQAHELFRSRIKGGR